MKKTTETLKIEISKKTIITLLIIFLGLYFSYILRETLVMLFFSFIITSTLLPIIKFLEKRNFSKITATLTVYLGLLVIGTGIMAAVATPLIKEVINLLNNFPELMQRAIESLNQFGQRIGLSKPILEANQVETELSSWIETNLGSLVTFGTDSLQDIVAYFANLFGGILKIASVLVVSFYLSIDFEKFEKAIITRISEKNMRKRIQKFLNALEDKLGRWLGGKMTMAVAVGIMAWILLSILGVPYALPLAMFAIMFDAIPNIGALLGATPALLIAIATGDPIKIIGVIIGYIIIQLIEDNILGPRIMATAIGLPPVLIIISVLIGAQLASIPGILIAIPISGVIHLVLKHFVEKDTK